MMDLGRFDQGIHNTCEVGRLRRVLLHRPGQELENLMPEYLERLLFDDIPYLKAAQEEHDAFAGCLRDCGVEVVYLKDLVVQSITDPGVRQELVSEFLDEAGDLRPTIRQLLQDYFQELDNEALVCSMMAGVRKEQVRSCGIDMAGGNLSLYTDEYPFLVDPMPNLYFTRDPFATIGSGVSIHRMYTTTRNRETLFGKFIFTHHPQYKDCPKWYDRADPTSLEGGDILVLSPEVLAVGISQRTEEDSIDRLAKTLLTEGGSFKKILAVNIPKARSFMHLDTVFTMVDRDKFTVHPNILRDITVYVLELKDGRVRIREEVGLLENILREHLGLDKVTLIKCGGNSPIDAAREQWSDGSNTLAIAPGEVVVYDRNYVTNRILEDNGITIHTMSCSELSRGRGGPRCMSMPLWREDI